MCTSHVSLLLFLLALPALSAFASYYELNIDCGSDTTHIDEQGREWVGDTAYTKSGKSMKLNKPLSRKADHVMDTLRVFSTGEKGCYSVPWVQQQVLVRASFYYNETIAFKLLLENSNWTEIETNSKQVFVAEATYVVAGGTVDVCVSPTSADQMAFMSALEIRSMSTDMYRDFDTDTAFIKKHRAFFGGHPGSYVLDPSGRTWQSVKPTLPYYVIKATSHASSDPTTDNLPKEVSRHAMTVPTVSDPLNLTFREILDDNLPVYVIMYFSEVTAHPTERRRSFNIYVDGDLSATNGPIIVPPYGHVSNYTMHHRFNNSSTMFSLKATRDSDLPPLINGYEVYSVISIVQPVARSGTPTSLSSITPALNAPSFSGATKKNRLPMNFGTKIPTVLWAMVGVYLWGAM